MTASDIIPSLSVVVLILAIIVLVYMIVVLYRANKVIGRFDNLTDSFHGFVSEIVPAIVNMGTISTAVHAIMRQLADHQDKNHPKK